MCDTSTIANIQLAAGSVQAGSQLAAGNANRGIAKYNEKVARQNAQQAILDGKEEEFRHRQKVRQLIGSQRAAAAAGGVGVSDGSALALQLDAAKLGELDALQIRANAAREAMKFKTQAKGFRFEGKQARNAGLFGAAGSVLGGAGQAARIRASAPNYYGPGGIFAP